VQSVEAIRGEAPGRLPRLSGYAERLYRRWIRGLRP